MASTRMSRDGWAVCVTRPPPPPRRHQPWGTDRNWPRWSRPRRRPPRARFPQRLQRHSGSPSDGPQTSHLGCPLSPRRGGCGRSTSSSTPAQADDRSRSSPSARSTPANASAVWSTARSLAIGFRYRQTTSGTLPDQLRVGGEPEALGPPQLDPVLAPRLGQRRCGVAQGRQPSQRQSRAWPNRNCSRRLKREAKSQILPDSPGRLTTTNVARRWSSLLASARSWRSARSRGCPGSRGS